MSKSLDGYYQETGRAGRDGKDSDCVLFYRGQDASRLSSLVYGDVDGTSKRKSNIILPDSAKRAVHEMLRFAQDLKTCRKIAFAKVRLGETKFSFSSHGSTSRPAPTSLRPHGTVVISLAPPAQPQPAASATTALAMPRHS